MTYLITGGAGFIGANFVKYMLKTHPHDKLLVLDSLTYAGNLKTIQEEIDSKRIIFFKGSICDPTIIQDIFALHSVDRIINFAAESHVDRSIENPQVFLETNILGTQNLMNSAKKVWQIGKDEQGYPRYQSGKKFLQVSTDEVYGSLNRDYPTAQPLGLSLELKSVVKNRSNLKAFGANFFNEDTPLDPRSPYSASKASADFIVQAYGETYKFPFNITRCSNNYGPYHFPEKLIPLTIKNILEGKKIPVYGKGNNVRDWLYVEDHCKAIALVSEKGRIGEVYNVGGFNEEQNITIVQLIIKTIARLLEENPSYRLHLRHDLPVGENFISYVQDRLGHDARYAIDPSKIASELGWYPETPFEKGIAQTVQWNLDNQEWVQSVASGEYLEFYKKNYGEQL